MTTPPDLLVIAERYAISRGIALMGLLGEGKDGTVWQTSRLSAVKVHTVEVSYCIERDVYIRLRELNIKEVAGFSVPVMRDHENEMRALEMTIVRPPFLLDFASAIFDEPPDFIEDEGHTFEDFIRSRFDEQTEAVLDLYHELAARTGIFLPDMHSQNVKFAEPPSDRQIQN